MSWRRFDVSRRADDADPPARDVGRSPHVVDALLLRRQQPAAKVLLDQVDV